jgi:hypothetical protein
MGRLYFLFFILILTPKVFSATHCACEIGWDKNEKFFYRLGCDMWLGKFKCDSKKVIDRKPGTKLQQYLPKIKSGDTLAIGYVGHWYNTRETLNYVENQLLPIAKTKGVQVLYDNTACNPMQDPEGVQDYLMELNIPQTSLVQVKGNQNISIGMWDDVHVGKTSFYAYASTEWSTAKFPPCNAFEGKVCSAAAQAGERGRCYNKQIKRLVWLTCQRPKSGKNGYEWTRN